MDKDIVDLIGDIDDILSFVEDVDGLENKLKRFADTIEQVLLAIHSCCSWVKKYLGANTAGVDPGGVHSNILTNHIGRTWKAFVEVEKLNDFKSELGRLSTKLNGAITLQMVHTLNGVSGEGKTNNCYPQFKRD